MGPVQYGSLESDLCAVSLQQLIRTLANRGVDVNHPIHRDERIDSIQISLVSCPNDQFLGSDNRERRVAQSIKLAGGLGILAGQINHHIGVDQRNHRAPANRAACP